MFGVLLRVGLIINDRRRRGSSDSELEFLTSEDTSHSQRYQQKNAKSKKCIGRF